MSETKLPPYMYGRELGPNERVWDEEAIRAYGDARAEAARLEERERAYQQAYTDALSHAAFYVNDHCQQGEYHAECIVGLKRPDAAAIRKGE